MRILCFGLGFLMSVLSFAVHAEESLCAEVKIEIQQEVSMERQGFEALMRITNSLDSFPLENVKVKVNFSDANDIPVVATSNTEASNAYFFIRVNGTRDITGLQQSANGQIDNGTIASKATGELRWLIIPTAKAAGQSKDGKLYYVGAELKYTYGGKEEVVTCAADSIVVKPQPALTLDYFLTQEVVGDNSFTSEVEAPEPYTLGVRISNNGYGFAKSVKIESAQPTIIENESSLAVGFKIIGSFIEDQPSSPSLLINFGDIEPQGTTTGRWIMQSNLAGTFTSFNASFTHADELGGALTSLLQATNANFLVHDVLMDLPGRDAIRDFLAYNSVHDLYVFESESTSSTETACNSCKPVNAVDATISSSSVISQFTHSVQTGLSLATAVDPFSGNRVLSKVVRADGSTVHPQNTWLSKKRAADKIHFNYFVNIFDNNSSGSYTLYWGANVVDLPQAPVFQFIPDGVTYEGGNIGFIVKATDPNQTIPTVSAVQLPVGATFTMSASNQGVFNWSPQVGQAGIYPITFSATDGALTSQTSMSIRVNTAADTDGDGMDDDWEREHFGNLSHDGTADSDNDGRTDFQEFADKTNPNILDALPAAPQIFTPIFDADTLQGASLPLQPVLVVTNGQHPANVGAVSIVYEVYKDEAMTDMVATATVDQASGATTSATITIDKLLNGASFEDNKYYYWRAKSQQKTGAASSSVWVKSKFFINTVNDAPSVPHISSPAQNGVVANLSPVLSVTNATDIDDHDSLSYSFAIYEESNLDTPIASASNLAPGVNGQTSWQLPILLSEDNNYLWQAKVSDGRGAEIATEWGSFFVSTVNGAPTKPQIDFPINGAVVQQPQGNTSVTLRVINSVDPERASLVYDFEWDKVNTFDSADKHSSSNVAAGTQGKTSLAITSLTENEIYYWRVRSFDGQVYSEWTSSQFTLSVLNEAPSVPTILNPANDAVVPSLRPLLEANAAVDPEGMPVTYRFEVYSTANLTGLVVQKVSTNAQWALDVDLVDKLKYYWRVRAEDERNLASAWSDVFSFTVALPPVNAVPALNFVLPNALVTDDQQSVLLQWVDSDIDSSAKINLYYRTANSNSIELTVIAQNLEEDLDDEHDQFVWNTSNVPAGDYDIFAEIRDEDTTKVIKSCCVVRVLPHSSSSSSSSSDSSVSSDASSDSSSSFASSSVSADSSSSSTNSSNLSSSSSVASSAQSSSSSSFANNETVDGTGGDDVLHGGLGNYTLKGYEGNDTLIGGAGNDTLNGGGGDDDLYGGPGDDVLIGDTGNDIYRWGRGDGNDTIEHWSWAPGNNEKLIFTSGILASDLHWTRIDNDLVAHIKDTGETLTIGAWFAVWFTKLNSIELADGTVLSIAAIELETQSINGTSGDDDLSGNASNDTLDGGDGDDTLYGGGGDDYLLGSAGNDTLNGGIGNDVLDGGTGNDTLNGHEGDDTMLGGTGNDVLAGGYGDDRLEGGAGNDTLTGNDGNDILLGGVGDDALNGGADDDDLYGGPGDDVLVGDTGNDTYRWGRGDGNDTIENWSWASGDNEKLIFTAGIVANDLHWTRIDNDLVVRIKDTGETLTIGAWFEVWFTKLNSIELSDGTVLSIAAIEFETRTINGTSGADQLFGHVTNDTLNGGDGNDILHGDSGDDILDAGAGNDALSGDQGNDTLLGGTGDDTLEGGDNNDVLDGGEGNDTLRGDYDDDTLLGGAGDDSLNGGVGNDDLYGGPGNDALKGDLGDDTYRWGRGDGNDIIDNHSWTWSDNEKLIFTTGLVASNLTWSRVENDLVAQIVDTGETLTISGWFNYWVAKLNSIQLADGTELSIAAIELETQNIGGTTGGDTLNGFATNDTISGGEGDDTINGNDGNDHLAGDAGSDLLSGGAGDDSLDGGADNDTLNGDEGNDTLLGGAGADTLNGGNDDDLMDGGDDDDALVGGYGNDTLLGGAGVDELSGGYGNDSLNGGAENDMLNGNEGNDTLLGGSGNDVLDGGADDDLLDGGDGDDTLQGGHGNDVLLGGAGADSLEGSYGDDDLYGGAGNDTLKGGYGNDTYRWGRGDGNDTLDNYWWEASTGDKLIFSTGIVANDLHWIRIDNDLIARIKDTDETLTIKEWYSGWVAKLNSIELVDGTQLNLAAIELEALNISGTSSGDTLNGFATNDTLNGGDGDDTINGNDGHDHLAGDAGSDLLSGGAGDDSLDGGADNDTLNGDEGNDTLLGGAGADTLNGGNDDDLMDGGDDDDILVGGYGNDTLLGGAGVDELSGGYGNDSLNGGAENDTLNGNEGNDTLLGGAGNDVLDGGADDDLLDGGEGNDTLQGGHGNDVLLGGAGADSLEGSYGDDDLYGGAGNDTLKGGYGNDTYRWGRGDGNDTIDNYAWESTDTNEKLIFSEGLIASDLQWVRIENDLVARIKDTSETLTIKEWFADWVANLNSIELADGTQLNLAAIELETQNITGTTNSDTLNGFATNDTLTGGEGDDTIYGNDGNDNLSGGAGSDFLYGGTGDDSLDGVTENDNLNGEGGNDTLLGGAGNDTLSGGWDDDLLDGEVGDDTLNGDDGNDTLLGGIGIDLLNGGKGNDSLDGGADNDTLNGGEGNDVLLGGAGGDILNGDDGDDTLDGGTGNDILNGSYGQDILFGGAGDDVMDGGYGDDDLYGGSGNDTLKGADGNDMYRWGRGDGNDIIDNYWWVASTGDKLILSTGITANDLRWTRIDNDLIAHIKDTEEALVIKEWFAVWMPKLNYIELANGTQLDLAAIELEAQAESE